MEFKSGFYLCALFLISASPMSNGYAFPPFNRNRFSSGVTTQQHFRRIRSTEIQALPDFMIAAIEEVKAIKAVDKHKEDELQELRKQLVELQNSNSSDTTPVASVDQAVEAKNQNGNHATTSAIIDIGGMTKEQMQLDLVMFQEFMAAYLVEAHEEKVKAIEAAETGIKSEYEEKIKMLLLQEGNSKNIEKDHTNVATNLMPLSRVYPEERSTSNNLIEPSNDVSKMHARQSIDSNMNNDMKETEAATATVTKTATTATTTTTTAATTTTINIGKIIAEATMTTAATTINIGKIIAEASSVGRDKNEKRQGRSHLPGPLADRISFGTEFENKIISAASLTDDLEESSSSPTPRAIFQDESPIESASKTPKITSAKITPTTAVDNSLGNSATKGKIVPPPSLVERIALGAEDRTLSPVKTPSPSETEGTESSPTSLINPAESIVSTVGAYSSSDNISKGENGPPPVEPTINSESQRNAPAAKSTKITAATTSDNSDVSKSDDRTTTPNKTLDMQLSVLPETTVSPAQSEDEPNSQNECLSATSTSSNFQADQEQAASVSQSTNQQDDGMPSPHKDLTIGWSAKNSRIGGEPSSESKLDTSTRGQRKDTNGINARAPVDQTGPSYGTKPGPKQSNLSTTLLTAKAGTKTKSLSIEDKIRIATAKSLNAKMSIRLSPNSCGRADGPSMSQTVNSFSRFQTPTGLQPNTIGSSASRLNPSSQIHSNSGDTFVNGNFRKSPALVGDKVAETQENVEETEEESSSKLPVEGNGARADSSINKREEESIRNERVAKLEAEKEDQRQRLIAVDRMNAARLAKELHRPKQSNALVIERRNDIMEQNGPRVSNSWRTSCVIQNGNLDREGRQADDNLKKKAGRTNELPTLAFRLESKNDRARLGRRVALGSPKIRNHSTALNVSPNAMSYPTSALNTVEVASAADHECQTNEVRCSSTVDPFKNGFQLLRPNSRGAAGSMFGSTHDWR